MKKCITVIALCFTFLNCSSTKDIASNDGSSIEKAIKVEKANEITKILNKKYCCLKSDRFEYSAGLCYASKITN
ncbi:hypothetical protein ACFFWB_21750 [Flavobacterium procerum]|uniref:hypothetical protein n=1 Tax=Flavobacterium procerum TaxID=1455569 RepID=UPI0035E71E2E